MRTDILGFGLGGGGGARQLGGRSQILIFKHLLHNPIVAHRHPPEPTALCPCRRVAEFGPSTDFAGCSRFRLEIRAFWLFHDKNARTDENWAIAEFAPA
ncbi:hypothetical protein LBMAG15_07760 [Actinomycetes bacterium]|nr:hypothetical protein LBMAG15_07760 [Actinomycetes bacterium]